jgi:ankyrin repeat protein
MTTPLHSAVRWNKPAAEIEDLIREHGADCTDNNGNHPIHIAAQNGHASLVSLILRHRADVNAQNNNGQTPLHMAVSYDLDDVEAVLRQAGAKGSILNAAGFPADAGVDGDVDQRRALTAFQQAETTQQMVQALTRIITVGKGDTGSIAKAGLEKKRTLKAQWTPEVQKYFTAAVQGAGLPPK